MSTPPRSEEAREAPRRRGGDRRARVGRGAGRAGSGRFLGRRRPSRWRGGEAGDERAGALLEFARQPRSARCLHAGGDPVRAPHPRTGARARGALCRGWGSGRRSSSGDRQSASGGQDRLRLPAGLQEPPRPGPGGEHRAHAGGEEVRPVPRSEALELRGVVDTCVHAALHPGQPPAGEAGHDPGPAEALLQPAEGEVAPLGDGHRSHP